MPQHLGKAYGQTLVSGDRQVLAVVRQALCREIPGARITLDGGHLLGTQGGIRRLRLGIIGQSTDHDEQRGIRRGQADTPHQIDQSVTIPGDRVRTCERIRFALIPEEHVDESCHLNRAFHGRPGGSATVPRGNRLRRLRIARQSYLTDSARGDPHARRRDPGPHTGCRPWIRHKRQRIDGRDPRRSSRIPRLYGVNGRSRGAEGIAHSVRLPGNDPRRGNAWSIGEGRWTSGARWHGSSARRDDDAQADHPQQSHRRYDRRWRTGSQVT